MAEHCAVAVLHAHRRDCQGFGLVSIVSADCPHGSGLRPKREGLGSAQLGRVSRSGCGSRLAALSWPGRAVQEWKFNGRKRVISADAGAGCAISLFHSLQHFYLPLSLLCSAREVEPPPASRAHAIHPSLWQTEATMRTELLFGQVRARRLANEIAEDAPRGCTRSSGSRKAESGPAELIDCSSTLHLTAFSSMHVSSLLIRFSRLGDLGEVRLGDPLDAPAVLRARLEEPLLRIVSFHALDQHLNLLQQVPALLPRLLDVLGPARISTHRPESCQSRCRAGTAVF
jgi:hypothetical protein